MQRVEQTKVYLQQGYITRVKYIQEIPLNISLNMNNKRQDCKIAIVSVCKGILMGGGRVNED
jgi:hypothetical protein